MSLTAASFFASDAQRIRADYGGYPYCEESPVDIGQQGGVVYSNYIWAQAYPTCSGHTDVAYDFHATTSPNVMTYIYIDYARAWVCGQMTYDNTQTIFNNVQSTSFDTVFFQNQGCGYQADQHVEFYKTGVIDSWSYTNL